RHQKLGQLVAGVLPVAPRQTVRAHREAGVEGHVGLQCAERDNARRLPLTGRRERDRCQYGRTAEDDNEQQLFHRSSFVDEIASTTRNGSSPARCAASAAARPEGASKTKKQISSSGTWIEYSRRTGVRSCVRTLAGERVRCSRGERSPAWPRARYVSTRKLGIPRRYDARVEA